MFAQAQLPVPNRTQTGDTISSGLEVTWSTTPTKWSNSFFQNLFGYEWELTKSPAGAYQWTPKDGADADKVPDAHDPSKHHSPAMLTTDLSLRLDPAYEKISRRFYENPDQFREAFAKAWFKLIHRDIGPRTRYLGPENPGEELIWQEPFPALNHALIDEEDIAFLKANILASALTVSELVSTARASAATFRGSDRLQESFACRPDRSGWLRSHRGCCEEGRTRGEGSVLAGTHGCDAGGDRCGFVRFRCVPQLLLTQQLFLRGF